MMYRGFIIRFRKKEETFSFIKPVYKPGFLYWMTGVDKYEYSETTETRWRAVIVPADSAPTQASRLPKAVGYAYECYGQKVWRNPRLLSVCSETAEWSIDDPIKLPNSFPNCEDAKAYAEGIIDGFWLEEEDPHRIAEYTITECPVCESPSLPPHVQGDAVASE